MHDYTVDDIKVMEGLEAVRVRPGMYIGSIGSRGLHHLLWEIVDNSVDEAANGYADTITVTLEKDGSALLSWTQSSATEGSYQGSGNFGGHGRR